SVALSCLYLSTLLVLFFFNGTAPTEIYTLSLHDALPIFLCRVSLFLSMALCLLLRLFVFRLLRLKRFSTLTLKVLNLFSRSRRKTNKRSEERFSRNAETDLVCRLLLEKKKKTKITPYQTQNE